LAFDAFDNDGNGLLDYVEWLVPHLSNQSFDIILIVQAEHLDGNRSFISDIFEEVRERDGVWSEEIGEREYVRVVFEVPLYDGRDITIWPRIVSGSPRIEVYERDGNETRAIFETIVNDSYNKVYLSGINGTQDTFDLRVLNGSVEIDHIIDPAPNLTLNSPDNNTNFAIDRNLIILNSSVNDSGDVYVRFFAINSTDSFGSDDLVYQDPSLSASSKVDFLYNITALPLQSDDPTLKLLLHFDNLSEFGENNTYAYNHANPASNGTVATDSFVHPNMSDGKFGGAWKFEGGTSNDHISYNLTNLSITDYPFTLSAWIKTGVTQDSIMSIGDASVALLHAEIKIFSSQAGALNRNATAQATATGTRIVNDNQWHYVVGVFNETQVDLYVDGELNATSTTAVVFPPGRDALYVGARVSTSPLAEFNGSLDDVAVWNRSLSADEIKDIYRLKLGTYYWKANASNAGGNSAETETREFTITGNTPSATLNAPDNRSIFYIDVFNITLNTTVNDFDGDTIDVRIYARNSTSGFGGNQSLVYQEIGVADGSVITYNITALPVGDDTSVLFLTHLDNSSEFGENDTHVLDFSTDGDDFYSTSNMTAFGNAYPNMSGGKFGGAWVFDGDGDYLDEIGSTGAASGDPTVSYSVWAKRAGEGASGYETIFQDNVANNGYSLTANCNGDGLLQFSVRFDTSTADKAYVNRSVIEDGEWHHIVGTYNASTILLYVDGTLRNSTVYTGGTTLGLQEIFIGGHGSGSGGGTSCDNTASAASFNGSIDEAVIYNRVLSAAQIKDLYRLPKDKYFWKVNVTDSGGLTLESETREFVVRETTYLDIDSAQSCTNLVDGSNDALNLYYGEVCSVSGYSECITFNSDVNISSGGTLSVASTCNLIMNASSDGGLDLIVEGDLNMNGGNITATSSANKFDTFSYTGVISDGDWGNFSFSNIQGGVNFSDSRIEFYDIDVDGHFIILNSTDITGTYTVGGSGRLDRQFRLNVTVLSSGSTISGALVNVSNVSGAYDWYGTTDANGVKWFNLSLLLYHCFLEHKSYNPLLLPHKKYFLQ